MIDGEARRDLANFADRGGARKTRTPWHDVRYRVLSEFRRYGRPWAAQDRHRCVESGSSKDEDEGRLPRLEAKDCQSRADRLDEVYFRAAQAYMLISMPTGTSTIFGVFQVIRVSQVFFGARFTPTAKLRPPRT
jgi:hypothetical protein